MMMSDYLTVRLTLKYGVSVFLNLFAQAHFSCNLVVVVWKHIELPLEQNHVKHTNACTRTHTPTRTHTHEHAHIRVHNEKLYQFSFLNLHHWCFAHIPSLLLNHPPLPLPSVL